MPTRSRSGIRSCCRHRTSTMNEHFTRRQALQSICAFAGSGITARLYAAPVSGPRFLLLFLRGGYDSTNVLVPYSSSYSYEVRPTIAIAKPDPDSNSGALALDDNWALTPALRD